MLKVIKRHLLFASVDISHMEPFVVTESPLSVADSTSGHELGLAAVSSKQNLDPPSPSHFEQ